MRRAFAAIAALTAACAFVTPGARAAAAAPYVAVDAMAKKLGWTYRRTEAGAIVDDGTGPQALRVGSRLVGEDGCDVALFEHAATLRDGHVELTIADAAALFHLDVPDVEIREIPRPATPAPLATATPRPAAYGTPEVVRGTTGTLALSVEFDGSNRIYQTNLAGNAGVVHGSVSSYGSAAVTNPVGAVTVGAPVRNVAFGAVENPLAGSVIANGSLTGLDAHLTHAGASYDLYSGSTLSGNVVAFARAAGTQTDALAYVTGYGERRQAIVRHAVSTNEAWGSLDYEALVGMYGSGEGIHARTKGKTFVEANLSAAAGSLPLVAGDLASGAVIGRHFGPVTTVTAGYVRSIAAPGSPTIGVTTRWNGLNLATNVSGRWTNFTAGYSGSRAFGQFFASTGAARIFGLTGGLDLQRAVAEVDLSSSGGATGGIMQLRTNHAGINVAGGFELNAGTLQPLVGVILPVAPALSFEAELVNGPSGHPAVRLSMLAGFRSAKPRVATFPVTVFVPDAQHYGPVRMFVDGAPSAQPFANATHVAMLPAGRHTVYVESADRSYGSPARDVVAGAATTVELALYPQRSITGTVRFGGPPDGIPADASLQGIRVVLEPSGEGAVTDTAGRFVFPRAPYDPASIILLDPGSVPSDFEAPPAEPIATGAAAIELLPARKVEHTSFR